MVELLKHTSSSRNADGWVGIMQTFFEGWKGRHADFTQCLGGEQSRLGLLILQERLKDRQRLLIGRRTERLRDGGTHRGIGMPRQISGNQYRRGIA